MAKKTERELLGEVVQRLMGEFSQLPAGLIATVVEDAYMHLQQSVIRDYIPLLVERRARKQLALPELAASAAERARAVSQPITDDALRSLPSSEHVTAAVNHRPGLSGVERVGVVVA